MENINGTLTLLNESGDLTISWEKSESEKMEQMIQSKINQGYSFFILKPSFLKLFKSKSTILNACDIKADKDGKYRVKLADKDAEKLFSDGHIGVGNTPSGDMDTTHRSTDIKEIAKSSSVAVRPMRAG